MSKIKKLTFKVVVNACTNQVYVIARKMQNLKNNYKTDYDFELQFESNHDDWNYFIIQGKVYDVNLDYHDEQCGLMVAIYDAPVGDELPYQNQHKVILKVVTNKTQWDKAIAPILKKVAKGEGDMQEVLSILTEREKIDRVNRLYSFEEQLEIIGYFDGSLEDEECEKIQRILNDKSLTVKESKREITRQYIINNGNFEMAIAVNKNLAI